MTTPTIRRVDQFTGSVSTNPQFPSRCEVCDVNVWFPTRKERREWEARHYQPGVD